MAGQFNTIRDEATGRLRKTTPEERERFQFSNIKSPPPAAGSVTQRDVDFVGQGSGVEPPPLPPAEPGAQPPALPPQAPPVQPPPLSQQPEQDFTGQGGAAGASAGSILGPAGAVAGAAIGTGLGFAASQSFKKSPIGSLEGSGQTGEGDIEVLRELLAVQRGIARVGSPIKNLVTTNSAGSRM